MHGSLSGFISTPGNDRADRRMQVLFVNGRLLRSTLETGAQSGLRVLAQIERTYILATDGSAIVLVDQHAAHERIAYERIVAAAAAATAPAEPLLVPFAFELSGDRVAVLERVLEPLRE